MRKTCGRPHRSVKSRSHEEEKRTSVTGGINKAESEARSSVSPRPDRGATFIELLIAIVLLGTVGLAVLVTFRVTIIGTRLERDHARALQWLQSAGAVVQQMPRESCKLGPSDTAYATGEQKVRERYQWAIQNLVENPPEWEPDQLTVVAPVQVWNGKIFHDPATPPPPPDGADCYDGLGKTLQLVKIQVEDPAGDIIESIEVVKSE